MVRQHQPRKVEASLRRYRNQHRQQQHRQRNQYGHKLWVRHRSVVRNTTVRRRQTPYSGVRNIQSAQHHEDASTAQQTQTTIRRGNAPAFSQIQTRLTRQARLEDWFITTCRRFSIPNTDFLKVWGVLRAALEREEHYLHSVDQLWALNILTNDERDFFDIILEQELVEQQDPVALEETLRTTYDAIRQHDARHVYTQHVHAPQNNAGEQRIA